METSNLRQPLAVVFCDIAGTSHLIAREGDLVTSTVLHDFFELSGRLSKEHDCPAIVVVDLVESTLTSNLFGWYAVGRQAIRDLRVLIDRRGREAPRAALSEEHGGRLAAEPGSPPQSRGPRGARTQPALRGPPGRGGYRLERSRGTACLARLPACS